MKYNYKKNKETYSAEYLRYIVTLFISKILRGKNEDINNLFQVRNNFKHVLILRILFLHFHYNKELLCKKIEHLSLFEKLFMFLPLGLKKENFYN